MNKSTEKFLEKYSRQIIIDKIGIVGQKKIANSSILIIGCGGLGTSASQYLAMSGIGHITLVDDDSITLSNLNRQTLFFENDIGKKKSLILSEQLKKINPIAKIESIDLRVNDKNIKKISKHFDIILDCSDNFKTRYLINKFCFFNKKILILAALQNFDVQACALSAWQTSNNPCYECIFPKSIKGAEESCDQMGIVAPIAGLGGITQAILVINTILQTNSEIYKELLLFDCLNRKFKTIKIKKNPKCKICNLKDYNPNSFE